MLVTLVSLALGLAALWLTPREEEPQIVVPLADVMISVPGLSAEEVERKVTSRLEKLLYQIDGVEYVYSMSRAGAEHRDRPLLCRGGPRGFAGQAVQQDPVQRRPDPAGGRGVGRQADRGGRRADRQRHVVVRAAGLYDDFHLHRMAAELQNELQAIRDTNRVWVIGGRQRRIRVELDPVRLAARHTSALQVARRCRPATCRCGPATSISRTGRFWWMPGRSSPTRANWRIWSSTCSPTGRSTCATWPPCWTAPRNWRATRGWDSARRRRTRPAPRSRRPCPGRARAAPGSPASCFPPSTSRWPSARAAMPSGWPRRSSGRCTNWLRRICPPASFSASRATMAKRPITRSTSWSKAWSSRC
jgi:hypothetical protein